MAKLAQARTPDEPRAAVLEIQGDKRALQMPNRQDNGLKDAVNEEIHSLYAMTDAAVEARIRESLAERDISVDRFDDVPSDIVQRIYNDEFYRAARAVIRA